MTSGLCSPLIGSIFLTFALGSEVWMLPCAFQSVYLPWLEGGGGQSGHEYWATTYPFSIGRTLGWPLASCSRLGWDIHDVVGELMGQLVHEFGKSYQLVLLQQCAVCVIPIHQKGVHDSNSDDITIYPVPPALGEPVLVDGKAPLT